jgi:hypothetical protein
VTAGREGHGEDLAPGDRAAQAGLQILLSQDAALEEPLHQLVVGLRHGLDELAAQGRGLFGELGRDLRRLGLAIAVAGEAVGFFAHQVDNPLETRLAADRQLDGEYGAAAALVQAVESTVEVGALAVHLGQVDHHRKAELLGGAPDLLGVDLDAGDAVDAEEDRVGGAQGGLGFGEEDAVAGAVDEVDLVLLPGDVAGGEADRDLAVDFFGVEVGQGVAVFHPVEACRDSTCVEQGAYERGLTGVVVPSNSEVADSFRPIHLHGSASFKGHVQGREYTTGLSRRRLGRSGAWPLRNSRNVCIYPLAGSSMGLTPGESRPRISIGFPCCP